MPVVSIGCITYNHENFIRDAIDGFLMQETTFPVEILIHDDASTDGTANIVREYEAKYPQLINPIYQTENQWSKGNRPSLINLERARGEFIALCEGDDYWTNPHKLQKQVGFLEHNPSIVGLFHATDMRSENGAYLGRLPARYGEHMLAFEDIITFNDRATCSMLYRCRRPELDLNWSNGLPMADWPLQATLAAIGPWKVLPEVMSVYRRHGGGVWSSLEAKDIMAGTLSFYNAVVRKFGCRALTVLGRKRKDLQAALLHTAVQCEDWVAARSYLAQYFLSLPERFTIPRGQKTNVARTLCSAFRL